MPLPIVAGIAVAYVVLACFAAWGEGCHAPQRGAAFALTRASRRARVRSIGSRSRARGSSLIFDHPPGAAPLRRPRPSTLAAVNLAPAVRHGCPSAGLASPLGSSPAAWSGVRPNQSRRARLANTMGIVVVAAFAANAAGVPLIVAITATFRLTRSAASAGKR